MGPSKFPTFPRDTPSCFGRCGGTRRWSLCHLQNHKLVTSARLDCAMRGREDASLTSGLPDWNCRGVLRLLIFFSDQDIWM